MLKIFLPMFIRKHIIFWDPIIACSNNNWMFNIQIDIAVFVTTFTSVFVFISSSLLQFHTIDRGNIKYYSTMQDETEINNFLCLKRDPFYYVPVELDKYIMLQSWQSYYHIIIISLVYVYIITQYRCIMNLLNLN